MQEIEYTYLWSESMRNGRWMTRITEVCITALKVPNDFKRHVSSRGLVLRTSKSATKTENVRALSRYENMGKCLVKDSALQNILESYEPANMPPCLRR
ncbi:hypothetical protein CEXT_799591 [Caerostris extrusa]|uniref:Uncharacterized protein n=1 Tax=Caerostris extrusa TaxID=172846 RepID=A0AAV4MW32_CAEEX|nr:hypothetical protein CEXT_799591 [Caerostris extrusa]